ncbi:MAG TPA: 6-hydroxymethylpterin diphosphokinase MptE-like protein [Spirochaetia bacterium]|nr:6-hydroxymethylpterin diphosphokinase MptE-like protein [Spirochaetia bacterium]
MKSQTLLERNLLSVSVGNPELSGRIQRAEPSGEFRLLTSRSGDPVPAIIREGYTHALHSQIDPHREAGRLVSGHESGGYFVCFGLGAGNHVQQLLEYDAVSHVLVIETDIALVRAAMESIDYRLLFLDSRVRLLIDPTPEELRRHLLSTYLPAVTGGLNTITLRSRTALCPTVFEQMVGVIRDAIGEIADDYTVQSYFGKRWFTNIVANLPLAEVDTVTLGPIRSAWVVAAGPSLEQQLELLRDRNTVSSAVISTDTALRALLECGIVPDIVVSIDCQHVSYHHFLGGYPEPVPLVLDLASPPVVARRAQRRVFFSSSHPFARYVNDKMRPFPILDTSGGNVTHAAVFLADVLGAREIHLLGADYSYPDGKTYARGTYLYPHFGARSSRVSPLESQFVTFLLRSNPVRRTRRGSAYLYTTKLLSAYKDRLEKLIGRLSAVVNPAPGLGLPIVPTPRADRRRKDEISIFAAGASKRSWREFLTAYRESIRDLPVPQSSYGIYTGSLTSDQQALVNTMLPVVAAVRHELTLAGSAGKGTPRRTEIHVSLSQLFSAAREWIDAVLAQALNSGST